MTLDELIPSLDLSFHCIHLKCVVGRITWNMFHNESQVSTTMPGVYCIQSMLTSFFFFFFFLLFRATCVAYGVPRLGVEWELQLLACSTATGTPDLSCICDLHHSSWQRQSPAYCVRPGIEPASSWIFVGFVTDEPQWELQ